MSESSICFKRALDLLPLSALDALPLLYCAEKLGHDPAICAAQRWYCQMLLGDFERAWRESDTIAVLRPACTERFWDGKTFDDKRLVVRCLHGLGDAIQFLRYLPALRSRAARIIVEAPLELTALLRSQPFIDETISWTDGTSKGFTAWDQQIEVMELPYAHRTTLETIPCCVPYLVVDELRKARSAREIFRSHRNTVNVGLVWSASNWNPLRSIPLSGLDPILTIAGIQFFSFQHGDRRHD